MKALADADFLVALAKEDDANHKRALRIVETLRDSTVFITPFTISEVVTVLSYKVSQQAAKEFLQSVRKKSFIELSLDTVVTKEADNIFLSRQERGVSWIDCINVAFVRLYRLDGILSFDKFYNKVGVTYLC